MGVTIGDAGLEFRVDDTWPTLPEGCILEDIGGVAVDGQGLVHVFHRGEQPVLVFTPDGQFVRSWGAGMFGRPHGIHIAGDGSIFLTDDGHHVVRKFSPEGELLLTLGEPDKTPGFMSGQPFCRCTHTALAPDGAIYVSDGYGNARIHKYTPDGELMMSWGQPGAEPGNFNLPHNIACDSHGMVYVADRENHRVQVFDGEGQLQDIWQSLHRPSAFTLNERQGLCYIGEIGPYLKSNRGTPNLGPRITVTTLSGEVVTRLQRDPSAGMEPGQFISPHGIAVDDRGDVYVGEVSGVAWPMLFPGEPTPPGLRRLHKLVRVQD